MCTMVYSESPASLITHLVFKADGFLEAQNECGSIRAKYTLYESADAKDQVQILVQNAQVNSIANCTGNVEHALIAHRLGHAERLVFTASLQELVVYTSQSSSLKLRAQ